MIQGIAVSCYRRGCTPFRSPPKRVAWMLAHIRKAAGKNVEARGFSQVALKEIGNGPGGSGLKAGLRELLETA
jgi:hypothetical protein